MIRPDIKTFHENRWRHRFSSRANRQDFLGQNGAEWFGHTETPAVNIKKEGTLFELEIAMPGFLKEEIEISVYDDVLTVKGAKGHEEKPTSQYVLQEFDVDILERNFQLAKGVTAEMITANYANGILKLKFKDVAVKEETVRSKVLVS